MTEQPPVKSIRWYSTVESAENLEISVLAVLESICAVSLSLWLAWHFQSYTHIVVAIVLAPLLLLRTEESTRLGLIWFVGFWAWWEKFSLIDDKSLNEFIKILLFSFVGFIFLITILWFVISFEVWVIFALIFLISWGVLFVLKRNLLSKSENRFLVVVLRIAVEVGTKTRLMSKKIVLILAILLLTAILINTLLYIDKTIVGIILFILFIIGILVMIFQMALILGVGGVGGVGVVIVTSNLLIKFTATTFTFFCHPLTSLQIIPKNWYRIVLATDMAHPPEWLPGIESQQYHNLIEKFDEFRFHKWLVHVKNNKHYDLDVVILTLFIFLPALLYRWSLKSSALFYLPFLWIIGTPRSIEEFKANIDEQIDLLKNSSFAIIRFRITLFFMIFTTLLPLCLRILIYYSQILPNDWRVWIDGIAPFVGTFETVQWGTWHVTNCLAQLGIILMWFYLERLEGQRKHRKEVGIHDGKAEFVFFWIRCNQVLFTFTMICQVYIMMPYLYNLPWTKILGNFQWLP